MKPAKVLCCMFSLAILGLTLQKLGKIQRWLCVLIQITSRSITITSNSYIVSEHKTTKVQGQRLSNISLSLFNCFFDVHRPS